MTQQGHLSGHIVRTQSLSRRKLIALYQTSVALRQVWGNRVCHRELSFEGESVLGQPDWLEIARGGHHSDYSDVVPRRGRSQL